MRIETETFSFEFDEKKIGIGEGDVTIIQHGVCEMYMMVPGKEMIQFLNKLSAFWWPDGRSLLEDPKTFRGFSFKESIDESKALYEGKPKDPIGNAFAEILEKSRESDLKIAMLEYPDQFKGKEAEITGMIDNAVKDAFDKIMAEIKFKVKEAKLQKLLKDGPPIFMDDGLRETRKLIDEAIADIVTADRIAELTKLQEIREAIMVLEDKAFAGNIQKVFGEEKIEGELVHSDHDILQEIKKEIVAGSMNTIIILQDILSAIKDENQRKLTMAEEQVKNVQTMMERLTAGLTIKHKG